MHREYLEAHNARKLAGWARLLAAEGAAPLCVLGVAPKGDWLRPVLVLNSAAEPNAIASALRQAAEEMEARAGAGDAC